MRKKVETKRVTLHALFFLLEISFVYLFLFFLKKGMYERCVKNTVVFVQSLLLQSGFSLAPLSYTFAHPACAIAVQLSLLMLNTVVVVASAVVVHVLHCDAMLELEKFLSKILKFSHSNTRGVIASFSFVVVEVRCCCCC